MVLHITINTINKKNSCSTTQHNAKIRYATLMQKLMQTNSNSVSYRKITETFKLSLWMQEKSPPGLEPGSLKYRSNALTTKLRRHMVKNMLFTSVSQAMDILVYTIHLCQGVF